MFTWRVGIVAVVVALAIAVVVPSLRVYFSQQATLAELTVQRDAAQADVDTLQANVDRWSDDAYVIAQARERLHLVFPGETAYTVTDPSVVEEHAAGSPAASRLPENQDVTAWYTALWASVEQAGAAATDGAGVAADGAASAAGTDPTAAKPGTS
ncbi:septum formation initiator family protein [Demequina capsici]|uniref:Septum formation initiator family protein n=1 Tax=Demequina capsici TaxID=3075620 RepID=A0AA96FG55_9MICO|nr:septum formation initiator family protein [Demequina sp. PMTSA13]WNM27956.1 septum formation initiator family protein [Demequina sp. PMTSA13]